MQPPLPPPSPPRPRRLSIATSSSSAAAPPARPSPRCWPSRAATSSLHREGAPPALSHRRIAAAGQRRPVRPPRRARAGRGDRHAEVRRRVRLARPRASPVHRVRRGLGQVDAVRLAGAALRARRDAVPQRRRARARAPSKAQRVREVAFDADGATVAGRARRRRAAQPGAPASSSTPPGRDTLLANQLALQGEEPAPQQLGALRPLHRRRAAARQARRQHHDLLVRARLVLVHPARRRHDQHRRGLLAVLPEVAQQAAARVLRATRSRCAPSSPSGSPAPSSSTTASTRPATTRTAARRAAASAT